MKVTELTHEDRAVIAEWFETQSYQVVKKVLELRRMTTAARLLTTYEHDHILRLQGKAEEDLEFHQFLKEVNKKYREAEKAKKENKT